MTSHTCGVRVMRPLARASTATAAKLLLRFDANVRPKLSALVASHPNFADLLGSFPGLLHALALDRSDEAREAARLMICAGAPLGAVARRLGVPLWLRRLPPEAFGMSVPKLPLSHGFALRVANHIPPVRETRRWLENLEFAVCSCGEEFAIWVARQHVLNARDLSAEDLAGLALFSWMSARPDLEAARFICKPFAASLNAGEAAERARDWIDRLQFPIHDAPYVTHASDVRVIDQFEFVPLLTVADVLGESEAMKNCLDTYGDCLGSGDIQVWSVRREGERVACVEIGVTAPGRGVPELKQVRGQGNSYVSGDVLRAVYNWLTTWPDLGADLAPRFRHDGPAIRNYQRLMKPYWREKGLVPWLPLMPEGWPLGDVARMLSNIRAVPAQRRRNRRRRHAQERGHAT